MRIAHVITRMILGGAQENTLLCCRDLVHTFRENVLLITGPAEGPEGSLLDRARAENVPLAIIPSLVRNLHPWHDWQAYRALQRTLREFKPDVVHTHSAKGGFLGRLAAWKLGVPAIVHTVHGAPYHAYQGRGARALFRACESYAAGRCHKLVSVADAMTEILVRDGVAPREKFVTIYSGIEVEPFLAANSHRDEWRRRLGYAPEHLVIGKIARLARLKGHDDVIEAAGALVSRFPHVRFLFVGDGPLRAALARRIERAGLSPFFQFTGLVPPADVPPYLGAVDIVVHASLREGLARALPQALIAGKPVVSYDIDGAREVVINGATGLLVPPCAVPALTAALEQLLASAPLRAELGAAGRARFTDQFRHETMTSRLHALYSEILRSR